MNPYDLYKKAVQDSFLSFGKQDFSELELSDMVNRFTSEMDRLSSEIPNGLIRERRILVIGGAGYIGSVLVTKLLNRGYKVSVLDCLMWDNGSTLFDLLDYPDFSFYYGNFGNHKDLEIAMKDVTDVVLLASLVGDPICKKYSDLAKKTNQDDTIRLVEFLNSHQINQFLFASTCSNYGLQKNDEPANEESELNPQSLYAETKIVVETHILDNLSSINYDPTILRFSTAYGLSRRMRFDLTINEFSRELALNKELLVYDENTWRPYCHTHDLSDAIIKVLETPSEKISGQVFNVGSNEENYTKKMIVDVIFEFMSDEMNIYYKEHGHDPRNYFVSFDKMKEVLQFTPQKNVKSFVPSLIAALHSGLFQDYETRKHFYGNYVIQNTTLVEN